MNDLQELYFKNANEWREWLALNYNNEPGVYLILYTVAHEMESMRWEEAVKVALCYGWIDSTAKSLGNGKRRQYFTSRNPKSVWSALNKKYIEMLIDEGLMHQSGLEAIALAKQNGSWFALDEVEKGIVPEDLQQAFQRNPKAYENYQSFAPSYRKSYLYWLNQAKRAETRHKRIVQIIELCANNIKSRDAR
ncbi:YdeI/OmpD-associated family protein [Marivirga sp. S37H4]|uniref:YdeI/OmpD-associated family protein n=1 Tax=Marivirga aurantiaca TaxID=2802615 RepID=A0A934WVT1_9BACT|nr:YdeI/OmpD-associated family protein [Marivirga aurantiaca]MBK6263835.1 YdeI/OmpD-associated family protein [Marivirga aurantiaca]